MLASIPAPLVREWMAWIALEHLGDGPESRADLRMAIMTATLANHWRHRTPLKIKDVMPTFDRPAQSAEQLYAGMIGYAARSVPKANPKVKGPDERAVAEP
jgi:hypothetical protein